MYHIVYYVVPVVVLIIVRKYRESKWGKCKNKVKLDKKLAIVTGANSGIGLQLAKELAARNAHVILACRDIEKAREACIYINQKLSADPVLIPMELDLASLQSITKFSEEIKKQFPEVNILVNNAGVSFPNTKRIETEDGFEIHFGVNHLGHFYLTNLLLDVLTAGSARVVVVSSSLHEKGEINLDDLNSLSLTKKTNLYANSKLANVYFAQELAQRTKGKINVYTCCPGWVYTNLFRHSIKWYHYFLILPVAFFFMRSPKQGAQTPLYCATEPDLEKETGLIYRDCKHYSSRAIFYSNIAAQLWEKSDEMIKEALQKHNRHGDGDS
ncbi:unnamed protein product [Callosobruchus maculatus]|uniref:Uncharacterized protein n=2 Tax=Callosobruchus maculatus TaxID=64391 RepID=A0A653DSI9_CALMS|nr:unnamed protein product [Callosobruchus maculatus]